MDYFDDPNLCLICFGYHPLKYCKYFKTFTTIQRIYLVNVHRYCPKCFSKAHLLEECTLIDSCSKCHGPHHTMLHQMEEECTTHEPCSPFQQCRSAACAVCEAARIRRRLHGDTTCPTFKSFRNEETFCNTARYNTMPHRTPEEQMAGTSTRKHTFEYRCRVAPDIPPSSQRTRPVRRHMPDVECGFSNSSSSFLARTPNRQTSTFSSSDLPFNTTSRWLESFAQSSRRIPFQSCYNDQTFPYSPGPSINRESQDSRMEVGDSVLDTQPVRFSSVSPKSELFSELSFGSISKKSPLSTSSECPLKRSSHERLSFSTRRSRSPSADSECCSENLEKGLFSQSAPKAGTKQMETDHKHKAFMPDYKSRPPETAADIQKAPLRCPKSPNPLSNETITIKNNKFETIQKQSGSVRKSQAATKRRSRYQTLVGQAQTQHEGVSKQSRGDHIHHQHLCQIQLYLQQLLGHLKGPKEYWHTPANWRRQTLLRQELAQLKSQLKQLILEIQRSPKLPTQSSNACRQQENLKTLFQQLLSLLQKCQALSSSRQLISSIQKLKEHLQHQVGATANATDKVISFQHFLKELQILEESCQETEKGRRVDLLQKRLGLRIILRRLLKAALEQLTDMLRVTVIL